MEIFSAKKEIILLKELAQKIGMPIYVVGGYVRNILAGFDCAGADIDICADFDSSLFDGTDVVQIPINKRIGTSKVSYRGISFEYTRFRAESYNAGGHHTPQSVDFVSDLSLDATRRDFAINSIYYDVLNGKIIDPLNGVDDIKNRVIRCDNPQKIFCSDGLRLLRLCRFAAQTGYKIEAQTKRMAKKFRANLADIACERKREELDKILVADTKYGIKNAHYRGLKLLGELRLWDYLIPQVEQMRGVKQNPKYHKFDVLEHSLRATKYAPENIRLTALLHDIGKPISLKADGKMFNHPNSGALEADKILHNLCYPVKQIDRIVKLIQLHMFDLNQTVREGKMRIFAAENFDYLDDLQALCVADGKATGQKNLYTPRFAQFKAKLIADNTPIRLTDLKIDGNDCLNSGLRGSEIGATLDRLWRECVLNPALNTREWLLDNI